MGTIRGYLNLLPGSSRKSSMVPALLLIFSLSCNEIEPDLLHENQVNRWRFVTERNGLGADYVNTVFEDSRGGMWVGTMGGVSFITAEGVMSYSVADGLLDNAVFAISEDREGNIWVGTRRGVNIFSDGDWFYFGFFYGAPVFALLHLRDDQGMLVGTGGYGIFRYNYETPGFSLFSAIDKCEACNSINAMIQSREGALWVATYDGARRLRGNFVTQFDETDGLAGTIATTIAEDSWGNIWVGTVEGRTISKIYGNSVSQVSFHNGAEQNFIFGIQEDDDGNLWVGTVDNGLFHFDGAIMRRVENGPTGNTITALFKDSMGNIWVGTSDQGLAIYMTNPRWR